MGLAVFLRRKTVKNPLVVLLQDGLRVAGVVGGPSRAVPKDDQPVSDGRRPEAAELQFGERGIGTGGERCPCGVTPPCTRPVGQVDRLAAVGGEEVRIVVAPG